MTAWQDTDPFNVSSGNSNPYLALINQCQLSFVDDEVLIGCLNDELFKAVYRWGYQIAEEIMKTASMEINRITIVTGNRRASLPVKPTVDLHLPNTMIQPQTSVRIPSLSDEDVIKEVLGFQGAAGIVRFRDNKGLLSNERVELASGTNPNDWQGQNMANYWPEDELLRFKRALLKDTQVLNYPYVAYLFSGEKASFLVEARLIYYRGDLVRVVKHIEPAKPLT